jgi:thymidylate synthase (FAD)
MSKFWGEVGAISELRRAFDHKGEDVEQIDVLDNGYVRLVNVYGTELDVVNAARVSYNKRSDEMGERDIKLLKFLIREHTSPFRHVHLSLEFKAPLIVARQHWRHIVGASTIEDGTPFSELSRRYVRDDEEYYIPQQWRMAPENSKQGSGGAASSELSSHLDALYEDFIDHANDLYNIALNMGIAPEQARLFMPGYALYTKYLWTPSLQAAMNFIDMRTAADSQQEIQDYAVAVKELVTRHFPNVFEE